MLTQEFSQNSFCDSITTMDTARHCVRRNTMVPHKEAEFSSQSIMKSMEKFVAAVQEMDETILVPSRLMDLQVGDPGDTAAVAHKGGDLAATDLHRLYKMVNSVRKELLWGGEGGAAGKSQQQQQQQTHEERKKGGHVRRPSTASTLSLSDTDSEAGNENDSGIEGEPEPPAPYTQRMEENFRRHLYGLHRCLDQMTSAATYLTKRYQNDIGTA